jgi:AcrR family transcriptional regulator
MSGTTENSSAARGTRGAPRGGRDAVVTRVLDAAEELFSEHPYADVSVRGIGEAAGVSHALVHRYVGSKADILRAVLARHEGVLAGAAAGAGTVREAAARMLSGDMRATQRYFRLVLRVSMDSVLRELTGASFEATRLLTSVAVQQSSGAGAARTGVDPRLGVAAVVSLVVGFAGLRDDLLREVGLSGLAVGDLDAQLARIVDTLLQATVPDPAAGDRGPGGPGSHGRDSGVPCPATGVPGSRPVPAAHDVREDREHTRQQEDV